MFNYGFPKDWSTIKKLIWLKRFVAASPSWVWQLVTGTAPLTLLDAVAHPIHSLTQYGLCVQDGTPTPDAPVDIVTNNGAIKYGALGRNLLDPSAANVVLGYYVAKADGEVRPSPANFMFAKYMPVEPGKTYVAYGRAKSGNDLSGYNRVAWYDSTKTWIAGADYTQNRIAVVTAPANAAFALLSVNPSGTSTTTVTQEMIDSYNWTFAEGTAEITPFVPFVGGIYTDGTPEVLTVSGKNLYNKADGVIHGYPSATGTWNTRSGEGSELSIIVTLEEGKTYTAQRASEANCPFRVMGSANRSLTNGQSLQVISAPSAITYNETTFTVPSGYPHIVFYVRNNAGTSLTINDVVNAFQVELGSTATAYEPYVTPQTVTDIPMLLGVGDYKDEGEIISGLLTHKVGIKVLDGTESWDKGTLPPYNYYYGGNTTLKATAEKELLCNQFGVGTRKIPKIGKICVRHARNGFIITPNDQTIDTVEKFKQFLAAQYANGTPVIVLYPIATEQTEQTTPHALHTSAGTNVVDVTANVSPVELAVEYAKEAS